MTFLDSVLDEIYKSRNIPQKQSFMNLASEVYSILLHEDESIRPRNKNKLAGSFIDLSSVKTDAIIVPDIHARKNLVHNLLFSPLQNLGLKSHPAFPCEKTILDKLQNSTVYIVFLGDVLHAERRAFERWTKAYDAFIDGDPCSPEMYAEMQEGLNCMQMLLLLKKAFPRIVHILKGNHENIENVDEGGNYAFHKFVAEGLMVKEFIQETYGNDFLQLYSRIEKLLPLAIKGEHFLASHAEPIKAFTRQELIDANLNPTTVAGLTWTRDGDVTDNSAEVMLDDFFANKKNVLYFAGHKSLAVSYCKRENTRFIQIHNPNLLQVAVIPKDGLPAIEELIKPVEKAF